MWLFHFEWNVDKYQYPTCRVQLGAQKGIDLYKQLSYFTIYAKYSLLGNHSLNIKLFCSKWGISMFLIISMPINAGI